jgi:hypothetical protein
VLPPSDAQWSHWLSSGSVTAEVTMAIDNRGCSRTHGDLGKSRGAVWKLAATCQPLFFLSFLNFLRISPIFEGSDFTEISQELHLAKKAPQWTRKARNCY